MKMKTDDKRFIKNELCVGMGIVLALIGAVLFVKAHSSGLYLLSGILVGWGSFLFAFPILLNMEVS